MLPNKLYKEWHCVNSMCKCVLYGPIKTMEEMDLECPYCHCGMKLIIQEGNTIDDCRGLPQNWDGYHADPIPDSVCDKAEKILTLFENAKYLEIFPTANQSIHIQFEKDNMYFEIDVFDDHYTTLLCNRTDENGEWKSMYGDVELNSSIEEPNSEIDTSIWGQI